MPVENKKEISEEDLNKWHEKAEMDELREALKRPFKDRLLMTTRLYKIQKMLQKAKITHRPYNLDK